MLKPRMDSAGGQGGRRRWMRGAAAVAIAIATLALPSAASAALTRDQVEGLLTKELRQRGLDAVTVSTCSPQNRGGHGVWVCNWHAHGTRTGRVPYDCRGRAVYSIAQHRWRVDRCRNRLQPQIPLTRSAGPQPQLGYNDYWIGFPNSTFDLLTRSGAGVARQNFSWQVVQPHRGDANWGYYDQLDQQFQAAGVRPLWILFDAPCWAQANSAGCSPSHTGLHPSSAHFDDYARFAAAVARRYPDSVGIEIWNEPNFNRFWGSKVNPEAYSRMFKKAFAAIKKASPRTQVYTAGLAPLANTSAAGMAYKRFLSRLYHDGAARRADAIGVHPFPTVGPSKRPKRKGYIARFRVHLGIFYRVMQKHHDRRSPMVITEVGVSTAGTEAYTPDQQARAMTAMYDITRHVKPLAGGAPRIPLIVFAQFVDNPDGMDKERGFGVVTADGTPKPALCAIASAHGTPC